MPGPPPKDPSIRQRTNRSSSRRTLAAVPDLGDRKRPNLPPPPDEDLGEGLTAPGRWNEAAYRFWREVWASPMAEAYTDADVEGLVILTYLVNRFWQAPTVALAAEIRQQRACFGLSPLDRRRLEWEIIKVDGAAAKAEAARPRPEAVDEVDPRTVLG